MAGAASDGPGDRRPRTRKRFAFTGISSRSLEVAHREWCSGADERHSIHEDSRRITDDLVLSIPWWTPRAWFCDLEF